MLSGQIGGDVNLQTDSLKLQDGANIAGNLNYKGGNEADIGTGATIAGDTDWEFAETMDRGTTVMRETRRPFMTVVWFLWSLASAADLVPYPDLAPRFLAKYSPAID